jgi:hypothetical protein
VPGLLPAPRQRLGRSRDVRIVRERPPHRRSDCSGRSSRHACCRIRCAASFPHPWWQRASRGTPATVVRPISAGAGTGAAGAARRQWPACAERWSNIGGASDASRNEAEGSRAWVVPTRVRRPRATLWPAYRRTPLW